MYPRYGQLDERPAIKATVTALTEGRRMSVVAAYRGS
jgi:hypothetical protein